MDIDRRGFLKVALYSLLASYLPFEEAWHYFDAPEGEVKKHSFSHEVIGNARMLMVGVVGKEGASMVVAGGVAMHKAYTQDLGDSQVNVWTLMDPPKETISILPVGVGPIDVGAVSTTVDVTDGIELAKLD